jgi:hypothetical protein
MIMQFLVFGSVFVLYYIYWFVYVKQSLHACNENYLIMV